MKALWRVIKDFTKKQATRVFVARKYKATSKEKENIIEVLSNKCNHNDSLELKQEQFEIITTKDQWIHSRPFYVFVKSIF